MKILLDTHAFLWYLLADPRLSKVAQNEMTNPANELLLSKASLWEIAIKMSIGKLSLPGPFSTVIPNQLQQSGLRVLETKLEHLAIIVALPFHHKDPFDRMLVAQAMVENCPVLSADPAFDAYAIQRLW